MIDNTNPLARDRARYVADAKRAGFRVVGYFFQTSLQDAIRRNSQRPSKQKIPVSGVTGTFRKLQVPALEEGFDALYTVTITSGGTFNVVPTQSQEPSGQG